MCYQQICKELYFDSTKILQGWKTFKWLPNKIHESATADSEFLVQQVSRVYLDLYSLKVGVNM